jgi:hypothetical protein
MQSILTDLVIKWVVTQIAAAGAAVKWADVQAAVNAKVAALTATFHVAFASAAIQQTADAVLAAVALLLGDTADMKAVLSALAAKDPVAAEAALKAALLKVAGGDWAKLIAAA